MNKIVIMITILISVGTVSAGLTPKPGSVDHRTRYVEYDPDQVYRLIGFYGYHITILFEPQEKVLKIAAGYASAWDITNQGNFITIKPKATNPDTNLFVVTDRRQYSFDLRAKVPKKGRINAMDPDQVFTLRFTYPKEKQAAKDLAAAIEKTKKGEEQARMEVARALPPKPHNAEYFFEGPSSIAPYEAWDDGTFTYFRFYAQQDLPAIFVVNEDGTESIVNKHFDQDVMVVERVSRKFVLRMGNSSVCIWNDNPQKLTPQSTRGASERGGERTIGGK